MEAVLVHSIHLHNICDSNYYHFVTLAHKFQKILKEIEIGNKHHPQNSIFKRHLSIHTWNIYIISTTCRARKGSQHCSIRHFLMCCRRCKGKRISICTNLKKYHKVWVKRLKSTYFLSSYYLRNIECSKIQLQVEYTQYNLEGKQNKCIKSCTFKNSWIFSLPLIF